MHPTRRTFIAAAAASPLLRSAAANAEGKSVTVGIALPLTGAGAEDAKNIQNGAVLAFDEANAAGGAGGYHIDILALDNGTATAGQYDPAQAAVTPARWSSTKP